jgi:hypothetical protein
MPSWWVREPCPDLLGDDGWRWRVLRTSNAYNFRDPGRAPSCTSRMRRRPGAVLSCPSVSEFDGASVLKCSFFAFGYLRLVSSTIFLIISVTSGETGIGCPSDSA